MAKVGKRTRAFREKLEEGKLYEIDQALTFVKDNASAKFVESIDVAINLGVDPRKSDQVVRSSTVLPNGTGNPDSMLCVLALNALQNSMILTPC